jgi:RNA polymerase sigma factor (TIGR02999 family)
MADITLLLDAAVAGDRQAAAALLPLVYDELRQLAAARLAAEPTGHTLQPTALVHEAYLRLVGPADDARWDSRGHFFAAAAQAMRRILVDHARGKGRQKRGGGGRRVDLDDHHPTVTPTPDRVLDLDEALTKLTAEDPAAAEVVTLHVFGGLSMEQAAACLGVSRTTAYEHWAYARAWLRRAIGDGDEAAAPPIS